MAFFGPQSGVLPRLAGVTSIRLDADVGTSALILAVLSGLACFGAGTPIEVRFDGYIGRKSDETRIRQQLEIEVDGGELIVFGLTNLIVLSPGAPSAGDLLASRQPTRPNFIFAGDKTLLDRIRQAAPTEFLRIRGNLLRSSRWVLVNSVERLPPGETPAAPTLRERLLGF